MGKGIERIVSHTGTGIAGTDKQSYPDQEKVENLKDILSLYSY